MSAAVVQVIRRLDGTYTVARDFPIERQWRSASLPPTTVVIGITIPKVLPSDLPVVIKYLSAAEAE